VSRTPDARRRLAELAHAVERVTPGTYLSFKSGLVGAGTVGGALLGGGEGGAARGRLLAVLLASLGALLPDRFLVLAAAKRREPIRPALPNAPHLLAVYEAGRGDGFLDNAFSGLV
jgi:hypothetical protein